MTPRGLALYRRAIFFLVFLIWNFALTFQTFFLFRTVSPFFSILRFRIQNQKVPSRVSEECSKLLRHVNDEFSNLSVLLECTLPPFSSLIETTKEERSHSSTKNFYHALPAIPHSTSCPTLPAPASSLFLRRSPIKPCNSRANRRITLSRASPSTCHRRSTTFGSARICVFQSLRC
jgi:hypothetical protein